MALPRGGACRGWTLGDGACGVWLLGEHSGVGPKVGGTCKEEILGPQA